MTPARHASAPIAARQGPICSLPVARPSIPCRPAPPRSAGARSRESAARAAAPASGSAQSAAPGPSCRAPNASVGCLFIQVYALIGGAARLGRAHARPNRGTWLFFSTPKMRGHTAEPNAHCEDAPPSISTFSSSGSSTRQHAPRSCHSRTRKNAGRLQSTRLAAGVLQQQKQQLERDAMLAGCAL